MKNLFKFNKEKNEVELKPINVPTNWDEITLGTYQKLQEYYKSLKDDEPIDTIKFIALLSNYSEDEVLLLPVAFVNNIVLKLDFLKKIPNPNVSNKITISGETYYLLNMDEMKFGEFTDVNMSIKNNPNDYASILAILCRKPNEIYDQEFINKRFEERKKLFESISVNQALSVLGFFLKYYEQYRIPSEDCINQLRQEVELYATSIENSLKNGAYRGLSTFFAKRKLKKYQKLLKQI